MARKTTPDSFARLVEAARAASPRIAITTDIIAGFPGESEKEFTESLAFTRRMNFAGGHIFTYSARPGTAAARMPNPVAKSIRKLRSAMLREAVAESGTRYRQSFAGEELEVLWESTDAYGPEGWRLHGLTDNYLRVTALSSERLWNQISRVRLTDVSEETALGQITGR
jgi:threonylcarbamoyladenosine tRNA methylthiotransferase MtaB